MFIKGVDLEYIRSYEQASLSFSEGTTVLSGDIGSGKTTILLAIEFALFGILRGKTSPGELLRHDATMGSVTLHLDIQGRDVIIKRQLKRGKDLISQPSGEITVDGETQALVATELKAKVLELLGYPPTLLAKSTNLFRYTVYTPQEQVKHILFETAEERKDIIRNIFNIDRYKRVAQNTAHYVTDVRERIARLKGQTDDVKSLREQLESQEREVKKLQERLPSLQKEVQSAWKLRQSKEKELDSLRKTIQEQKDKKSSLESTKKELESKEQLLADTKSQIKSLLEKKPPETMAFDQTKKEELLKSQTSLAEKKSQLSRNFGMIEAKREQAKKLTKNIESLVICPTCKQEVSSKHKHLVEEQQEVQFAKLMEHEEKLKVLREKIKKKEEELSKSLEENATAEKKYLLYKQRVEMFNKDQERLKFLQNQEVKLKDELTVINFKRKELEKVLATQTIIDAEPLQKDFLQAQEKERLAELNLKELQTKIEVNAKMLATLQSAIKEKELIEHNITKLSSIKHWLSELFIPLVQTMEKRVLSKVYQEFSAYFVRWFDLLIEDETLSVSLDEDFAPVVTQSGFDTALTNLSGGEKTSVALAYRLALNKVLNDYFGMIHTKGLLILDEPTDGFSAQQLDKLREVLEQLGVKQLIIVSHEAKLESLAQHHIRIERTGLQSKVFA